MKVQTRNRRGERSGAGRRAVWLQWTAASFIVAAAVTLLATTFYAGLSRLPPGWRVAQGPSLAHERVVPREEAGRQAQDTRIIVR